MGPTFPGLLMTPALFSVSAQDEPWTLEKLRQLMKTPVESATKTLHPLDEAPAAITIITAQEIQDSGAATLAELLKRVQGIQIGDNRANVLMTWIRGVTTTYNEKVLLLVNGIPKRDATLSEWAPDERIDLQNVERIEIIRGPGSAVHGGNAYAGVISIYTRKNPGPLRASVSGGGEGTAEASFQGGLEQDGQTFAFAARTFKTDGYLSDRGLKGGPTNNTNARAARNFQLSGDLGGGFTFDLVHGGLDYRYPMHELNVRRDATYVYTLGGLTYRSAGPRLDWTSRFYFDNTRIAFHELNRFPTQAINQMKDQDKEGMVLGLESQWNWKFGPGAQGLFGLNAEKNKATYSEEEWDPASSDPTKLHFFNSWLSKDGEGPGRNSARTFNYSAFAQGEAQAWEGALLLTAGLRYDRFEGFGGELSPRVGLVGTFSDATTLKLLYGQAFRPPTFRQLYVVRFDGLQPGNPDLRPERARTFELELNHRLRRDANAKLGCFITTLTDTNVTIADGRWLNSPIPRKLLGVEGELRAEASLDFLGFRNLAWFLNGAYLLKAYDDTPLGRVDIASVAPLTANTGITLKGPRHTLFTALNWVGRRNPGFVYDPGSGAIVYTYHSSITAANQAYKDMDNKGGYVVQDLNFAWSFGARRATRLEFQIQNLWDVKYYNPTHDPDIYYDVLRQRRNAVLKVVRTF